MKNKHFNIIWCGEIDNVRYLHKFKYFGRVFVVARHKTGLSYMGIRYDIYDYLTGLKIAGNYNELQTLKSDAKEWISRNIDILNAHQLNETNIINK